MNLPRLGVPPPPQPGASADVDIKRLLVLRTVPASALRVAYGVTSRQVHPDKCSLSDAKEAMQRVNSAWSKVSTGPKREQVDTALLQKAIHKRETEAEQARAEAVQQQAASSSKARKRASEPKPCAADKASHEGAEKQHQPQKKAKHCPQQKSDQLQTTAPAPSSSSWQAPAPGPAEQTKKTKCGMYDVRHFKGFFTVKAVCEASRKFKHEDWHSGPVALSVAVHFGAAATDLMYEFDHKRSKKANKAEMLAEHGIATDSKKTVQGMRDVLEEASATRVHILPMGSRQCACAKGGPAGRPYSIYGFTSMGL